MRARKGAKEREKSKGSLWRLDLQAAAGMARGAYHTIVPGVLSGRSGERIPEAQGSRDLWSRWCSEDEVGVSWAGFCSGSSEGLPPLHQAWGSFLPASLPMAPS